MYGSDLVKDDWGLWSHASWREVVIGGSYIVTTAFFSYVMGNIGNDYAVDSKLTRNMVTIAVGFFVPYTATQFSTLQKINEMKSENLSLHGVIKKQLSQLENKYVPDPIHPQIERMQQLTQLIHSIKRAAYNCLHIEHIGLQKNSHEHILQTKQLLNAFSEHLTQFVTSLPESGDQLEPDVLTKEIGFWNRKAQLLKNDLIPEEESPQMTLKAAM